MKKLLSLIINIANDNYYEDLIFRAQKTLDLNLFFLNKIKDKKKVEIIYVDWGSKKKISDLIFVNKNFKNQVKFIHVNEKLTKKYSKNFPNNFNHEVSYNVGIRRAKGKYILQTASDQFFNFNMWKNLLSFIGSPKLEKKNIYLIPRKIIDFNFYKSNQKNINYEKFLDYLNSTNYNFKAHTFYSGGGFSTMLSKYNFNALRGLNEIMTPGTSNDSELILRTNLLGLNKINTDNIGVHMFKFPPLKNSLRNELIRSNSLRKKPSLPDRYNPNNSSWGMKNQKLKISYAKNLSASFENSINIPNKNFKDSDENKLNIYDTLLNTDQLHIRNIFQLHKIFTIIKIIKIFEINKLVEFGYSNSSTLEIIGNKFKYLDILFYDFSKKNLGYGYYKRIGKIIKSFDTKRYGLFNSIISKNTQYFYNYVNKNFSSDTNNLLIINQKENNFSKNIKFKLFKEGYHKKFDFILIFNFRINEKLSRISKNNLKFDLINKDTLLILKNKKLDEARFKDLHVSRVNIFSTYLIFLIHRIFSKFLKKLRSLIYSFIK